LSKKFFCAINQEKKLSCFRVLPAKSILVKLPLPKFLMDDVVDVSVGKTHICVVSSYKAIVCFNYANKGYNRISYNLMKVPAPL